MFKRLDPRDINITPWKAYKEFTVTNVDSGSGVYGFRAVSSSIQGFDTSTSAKTTFSSASFYHLPTWFMINRMYYKDTGNNFNNFGQNNGKQYRLLQPSSSIISVPQKLFGERIRPKSITLTDDSGASTLTIKDDGNGNLVGAGNGKINYETGEIRFTSLPNANFVINCIHKSAHAGGVENSNLAHRNSIMYIGARSVNPKLNTNVKILAYN